MKRSEINKIMCECVKFCAEMHFMLPPFAFFRPEDWEGKAGEYYEVRDNMLGWDITDFGKGDFYKMGLLMFTIRNGNFTDKKYKKPYAEKLLIVEDAQITPYHFHHKKMEDIINRGGGNLIVKVYNSAGDESLADTPVRVSVDGRNYDVPAGTEIKLTPGESISLPNGMYHSFWGERKVLVGEVSVINDDRVDNRFLEPVGRFPEIEEDEAPLYLLGNEYPF